VLQAPLKSRVLGVQGEAYVWHAQTGKKLKLPCSFLAEDEGRMYGDAKALLCSRVRVDAFSCWLLPDGRGLPMTVQGRGRARGCTPFSVRGMTMRTLLGNCHGKDKKCGRSVRAQTRRLSVCPNLSLEKKGLGCDFRRGEGVFTVLNWMMVSPLRVLPAVLWRVSPVLAWKRTHCPLKPPRHMIHECSGTSIHCRLSV